MMRRQMTRQRPLEPDHIRIMPRQPPSLDPDTVAGPDSSHHVALIVKIIQHRPLIGNGDIQSTQLQFVKNPRQFSYPGNRKVGISTIRYTLPFKLLRKISLRKGMGEWISYQPKLSHLEDSLSKNIWNVSPLNPTRIASIAITSEGAIFPRFTLQPISSIKYSCWAFCGASQRIFSAGICVRISCTSPSRTSPLPRYIPTLPASL